MNGSTFHQIFTGDSPESLKRDVLARINREKALRAKRRLTAFALALTASCGTCAAAVWSTYVKWMSSSAPKYFSLLLSDRSQVFAVWKQFVAVIAESAPLPTFALALTALAAALYFSKRLVDSMPSTHIILTS